MSPTPRALLVLALGLPLAAAPTAYEPLALVVVAAWLLLLVLGVFDAWVLTRTKLALHASPPRVVSVGERAEIHVAVDSEVFAPLELRLRTEVEAPLENARELGVRLTGPRTETTLAVPAPRRGRAQLLAVWSDLRGPLGLVSEVRRFPVTAPPIDVVPDVARIAKTVVAHLGAEQMLGGLMRDPWAGHGSEFESLQGYVQGMDPRGVDWKASARHHALRIRRFHLERRQRVVVSVDVGRAMGDPIEGLDRLDHAAHTALALARAALVAGDLVGLHAYAARPVAFVPPKGGIGQFQRLRRHAAELSVRNEETNHVLGLRDLLVRIDRRSFVVVFTEFSDVTTAELMIDVLGQLARKNLVVFVALDDPTILRSLDHPPSSPRGVATSVVAATLAERRLEVLARLSGLGVHVIHTRPGVVATRVLDRYLEVKRKGLLA